MGSPEVDPMLQALLEDPGRADVVVTLRLLDRLASEDPLLERAVMLAAVPRRFDRLMLARLLALPPAGPTLLAAFGSLTDLSFVHPSGPDSWRILGRVRKALLARWDDGHRDDDGSADGRDLMAVLGALGEVYEQRFQSARRRAAALSQAAAVIRSADLDRYASLRDEVEDQLVRNAVETVHTGLRQSLDAGWSRMHAAFADLAARRMLHLVDVLARTWDADRGLVPEAEQELHRAWGRWLVACVAVERQEWDQALAALDDVADPVSLDLRYATWHHSTRASALRGACRFEEARLAMHAEIVIHGSHVDDWNAWTPWMQLADLHGMLWDGEAEVTAAEEGLTLAEQVSTTFGAVGARIRLTGSLPTVGRVEEAYEQLFRALRQARASVREQPTAADRALNRSVSLAALDLLGGSSPRLCDVLAEQVRQLSREEGDDGELDVLLQLAAVVLRAGDRRGGRALFAQARDLARREVPERLWQVEADEAQHAGQLGALLEGSRLNLRLLEDARATGDRWTQARCLTNAAGDLLLAGRFEAAEDLRARAAVHWSDMQHPGGTSFVEALRGELLRRRGDLVAARAALDGADVGPLRGFESDRLEYSARLALDMAEPERAVRDAGRAHEIARDHDMVLPAVDTGVLLVRSLAAAHRPREAVAAQEQVTTLLRRLQERVEWQPTDATRLADQHAARALRILAAGFGSLRARTGAALEHLDEAERNDPQVPWFAVEAAFVEVAAGRPKQAARRLEDVADRFTDRAMRAAVRRVRSEL